MMDERIDELMIEAGARFEFLHGVHYDDFQYKKFAELIIRECISMVERAVKVELDPVACLKEHFGVK